MDAAMHQRQTEGADASMPASLAVAGIDRLAVPVEDDHAAGGTEQELRDLPEVPGRTGFGLDGPAEAGKITANSSAASSKMLSQDSRSRQLSDHTGPTVEPPCRLENSSRFSMVRLWPHGGKASSEGRPEMVYA